MNLRVPPDADDAHKMAAAAQTPLVTTPCKVVDTANLTISEYFGHVASKDGTCSFAVVEVRAADSAAFQTPAFAEYVICNQGIIELEHSDGEIVRVEPGQGAFLPSKLRLRWRFPGPCNYTVVCMPAFSPELAAHEEVTLTLTLALTLALTQAWSCPGRRPASCPIEAQALTPTLTLTLTLTLILALALALALALTLTLARRGWGS